MSIEVLLIIIVSVSGVALVLQGIAVWQASREVREAVRRLNQRSESLEKEAKQVLEQMKGFSSSLDILGKVSGNLGRHVEEISELFAVRTREIDQLVVELTEVARKQAANVDEVVSDTVKKFEDTTHVIQQDVLRPAVEVSSFLKGVKTGLGYLFSKKNVKSPEEMLADEYEEEELFI